MDTLQGDVISKALDFISKEIVRVSEEKKIAALVKKATYTRRIREAEESGRRQAEDVLRKKKEQYFKAVMDVHASTSHRLLDEVFNEAVSTVSRRAAHKSTSIRNNFLNTLSEHAEQEMGADEEVVADLVSTFLIPEVERQRVKRAETVDSRRHTHAAYDTVQKM